MAEEKEERQTESSAQVEKSAPHKPIRCKILLSSPDTLDQEEIFVARGVLGKAFSPDASRQLIEEAIHQACGQKPEGLNMFFTRKFQAVLQSVEEAEKLLAVGLRVAGRPTRMCKGSSEAMRNLASLDVPLYWVLLPGLPPQCLESLKSIGDALGVFVSSEKSREEMLNGATPLIGVQIPDSVPLQLDVEVA